MGSDEVSRIGGVGTAIPFVEDLRVGGRMRPFVATRTVHGSSGVRRRTTRPPGVGHDIAGRLATGYGAQDADGAVRLKGATSGWGL